MESINYKEECAKIPKVFNILFRDLEKDEGGHLHRNPGETDITTGLGIYKGANPKAKIFEYIASVALPVTTTASNGWSPATIDKVNLLLDKDAMTYYSYLFYKDFYAELPMELLPEDTLLDSCNLYANSPEGLKLSLQRAIFEVNEMKYINIPKEDIYEPVPNIGPKTKRNLELIKNSTPECQKVFNLCVLLYMKTYYINIITSNKEKVAEASKYIPFLKFIKGVDSRVNSKID